MQIRLAETQANVRVAIRTRTPLVDLWLCALTEVPGAVQMAG